jgi:uncharacterized protein YwbE
MLLAKAVCKGKEVEVVLVQAKNEGGFAKGVVERCLNSDGCDKHQCLIGLWIQGAKVICPKHKCEAMPVNAIDPDTKWLCLKCVESQNCRTSVRICEYCG